MQLLWSFLAVLLVRLCCATDRYLHSLTSDARINFQVQYGAEMKDIGFAFRKHEYIVTSSFNFCEKSHINDSDCLSIIDLYWQLHLRDAVIDPADRVVYDIHEQHAGLSEKEKKSIQSFVEMISPNLCRNTEASVTQRSNLHEMFTFSQKQKWIGGENGNLRDSYNAYIPCEDDAKWWVAGAWQPVPMYSTLFNQEMSISRCPGEVVKNGLRHCSVDAALTGDCTDGYFPLCGYYITAHRASHTTHQHHKQQEEAQMHTNNCLVYSFGIDGYMLLENYLAKEYGCEVHGFDPADDSRGTSEAFFKEPGVHFHYQGLGGRESLSSSLPSSLAAASTPSPVPNAALAEVIGDAIGDGKSNSSDYVVYALKSYGNMGGELNSLDLLLEQNGHGPIVIADGGISSDSSPTANNSRGSSTAQRDGTRRRTNLTVLQIDIEGAEWVELDHIARETPHLLDDVCTIIMEMHLTTTMHMATGTELRLLASFWDNFIVKMGFRVGWIHANPGTSLDRYQVNPALIKLGLRDDICCYDIALYRNDCTLLPEENV